MYKFTKIESYSISTIRAISVLMIFFCHILQGIDSIMAWWLNVGVQIFLFMSGFLISSKDINNFYKFIKERLKKILTPIYLFLFIYLFIYQYLYKDLSFKNIITYIFQIQGYNWKVVKTVPGLTHLWFISVIVFSYLVTYFLHKFLLKVKFYNEKKFYLSVFLLFLISLPLIVVFRTNFFWIWIYITGYFIGGYFRGEVKNNIVKVLFFINILVLSIRIYLQYFYKLDSFLFLSIYIPISHSLLGIFLFCFLYNFFKQYYRDKEILSKKIIYLDKYSYEIYIVHHIFILGPLSILNIKNKIFSTIIIILITMVAAYLLKRLVSILNNIFIKNT